MNFGGSSSGGDSSVFLLKSSKGEVIKTYKVPTEKVESFTKDIKGECERLEKERGESLTLIKVERLF